MQEYGPVRWLRTCSDIADKPRAHLTVIGLPHGKDFLSLDVDLLSSIGSSIGGLEIGLNVQRILGRCSPETLGPTDPLRAGDIQERVKEIGPNLGSVKLSLIILLT